MTECYAPPKGLEAPVFTGGTDWDEHEKKENEFIVNLRKWCHDNSNCKDAGFVIGFPMGDGEAEYMVLTYGKLIHLATGDAWQIPDAHMRGLRAADVKQRISMKRNHAKLFSSLKQR